MYDMYVGSTALVSPGAMRRLVGHYAFPAIVFVFSYFIFELSLVKFRSVFVTSRARL